MFDGYPQRAMEQRVFQGMEYEPQLPDEAGGPQEGFGKVRASDNTIKELTNIGSGSQHGGQCER